MRDLFVILFLSVFVPMAFRFPYIGVSLWIWIALFNPQRLMYGFLAGGQLNQIVALLTLGIWLFSREPKKIPVNAVTVSLLLFAAWFTLTTLTVATAPSAWELWDRNIKSVLLVVVVIAFTTSRERVHVLIWVFVVSIGYFSARNGLQTIASGGTSLRGGPPMSHIADNNHLALALVMTLPLMRYLQIYSQNALIRLALGANMILSVFAVLGSYSRGGFIALVAVGGALWWRSKGKLKTLAVVAVLAVIGATFMPQQYKDRLSTIGEAGEDESFQGRLSAWVVAIGVASDMPLGAGFEGPIQSRIWDRYLPEEGSHAAHSIYFMVLGEQGFFGLAIYLTFCLSAWSTASYARRVGQSSPEIAWLGGLGSMIQVSLFGFFLGGAALSMSYWDGFLMIAGVTAVFPALAQKYSRNKAIETSRVKFKSAKSSGRPQGPIPPSNQHRHLRKKSWNAS